MCKQVTLCFLNPKKNHSKDICGTVTQGSYTTNATAADCCIWMSSIIVNKCHLQVFLALNWLHSKNTCLLFILRQIFV